MKKIKGTPSKPTTAAKKSSSKTSKSKSDKSLAEKNTSSMQQSKRATSRSQQSETEEVYKSAVTDAITSHNSIEMALEESEDAFRTLAESVPHIVWATRADGWNIFFNKRWVEYTGLSLEESYGHGWNIPFHPDDKKRAWDAWQNATKHGATYSLEVRLRRADGVYRWWLVRGVPLLDTTGEIIKWFGTCTDIDDLKQAERRQTLSTEIFGILNNPLSMDVAISKIITTLKRETGFDAIGIRLQRGDDFPYIAQDGFSKEFILAENTLAVRSQDGGVCVDKDGNVSLECTCGMVIAGKTDPTNPIFTPNGSCWTNESCARPDRPIEDKRLHPRDRCTHEGYHSVALIPLRTGERIIGILQLNDRRPNQFTLEMISFLEDMGALIGIAVARKRAEDEMQKAKERADALNLQLEAANKELEERVAARTADLSRINEQLTQEVGERKRSEEAQRHTAEELQRLLDVVPAAVWVARDQQCLTITGNRWADQFYEAKSGENVSATTLPEARRFFDHNGRELAASELPMQVAVATNQVVRDVELHVHLPSGRKMTMLGSAIPLTDATNNVRGCIGAFIDITDRKRAEDALTTAKDKLAADLDAMTRLQTIATLFVREGDMRAVLDKIVETAIAITNADMGNIQLLDRQSGCLKIMTHRGFEQPFLDYWNSVAEGCGTCGTALARKERVIIEDVIQSPIFVGNPALDVQLAAGVRAVQSTPLMSRSGKPLGMFSTHFRNPHRPDERSLQLLDLLARQAADIVERAQTEEALKRAHDELELQVLQRTSELSVTNEELFAQLEQRKEAEDRISRLNRLYSVLSKVNETIVRIHDSKELFERVCRIAVEDGLFKMAWIGLVDLDSRIVKPTASYGDTDGYLTGVEVYAADMPEGKGPTGKAVFEGKYSISGDIEQDPSMLPWRERALRHGLYSSAAFPISARSGVIGALTVYSGKAYFFTYEEIQLLTALAEDVSFAIDAMSNKKNRLAAENALRKLNSELEDRVAARTTDLDTSNKELEAFSYSVSHDLRAPLRHISGFMQLLRKQLKDHPDKETHRYVDVISDASNKMGKLIDDLLAFSQLGRSEMRKKKVNLNSIVKEVVREIQGEVKERKIRWEINELSIVLGDRALLRLAIVNLISNAVKFTSTRSEAEIKIGCKDEGDNFTCSIADNGVGFNMQYAGRLFGVFQRLHTQAEFEGTGIGLANVQRIISRHGGKVWAESVEGQGATFYFTLPKTKGGEHAGS